MNFFLLYSRPNIATATGFVWDTAKSGVGITLTDAERTAASSTSGHVSLTNQPLPATGKYYWELAVVNTSGYSAPYCGVIGDYKDAPPKSYDTWANAGDYSLQLAIRDNFISVNGGASTGYPDSPANDTIRFAYDADTRKMWVGSVGLGGWFGGGNPAAGTGQVATLTADTYYIACGPRVFSDTSTVTLKTMSGEILSTAPSGFSLLE